MKILNQFVFYLQRGDTNIKNSAYSRDSSVNMEPAADVRTNRFFSPFSERARRELLARAVREIHPEGTAIFEEEAPADSVYLVLFGEVALVKNTGRGRSEVIARIGPGDYFGEMGVLDGGGRSAGARAAVEATLVRIPAGPLREVLLHEPSHVSLDFLRRVSERLRTANARFVAEVLRKEKLESVGEMAGSIIHDFKNPMTSIKLAAEVIAQNHPDTETVRFCEMIRRQVVRMVAMAQEVLDYCRGESSLNRTKVAVADLFREIETLNRDYLRDKGVSVSFRPYAAWVEVDSSRIIRSLQNILSNAVEVLGPEGGKIEFSADETGPAEVEIRITDNGPGIPAVIRDTLFQPFVTSGKQHGTGLGLAIAKAVVEAHGGTIAHHPAAGGGTTFSIRLPRCQ